MLCAQIKQQEKQVQFFFQPSTNESEAAGAWLYTHPAVRGSGALDSNIHAVFFIIYTY